MASPFRAASYASMIPAVINLLGKSSLNPLQKRPISTPMSEQLAAEKAAFPLPPFYSSLSGAFVRKTLLHGRAYSSNFTTALNDTGLWSSITRRILAESFSMGALQLERCPRQQRHDNSIFACIYIAFSFDRMKWSLPSGCSEMHFRSIQTQWPKCSALRSGSRIANDHK